MIKHHTTHRALTPGAILAAAALVLAGCSGDDDTDAADVASDISVELSPEAEEALDEAQDAVEEAQEQAEQASEEAEEALDDVLASVPDVEGEPSGEVDPTLPSADQMEQLGECFGLDFDDLEDALDDLDDIDFGTVPGGSVPFDMSMFEDLEELSEMTPEELSEMTPEEVQQMFEDEFEELQGALSSLPEMPEITMPEITMPEITMPEITMPFDAGELEDCLRDATER